MPTAANGEFGDKQSWFIKDLIVLKDMKFKEIDIVDFSAIPRDCWLKRLKAADAIFVEGGNTYHLIYWMKKSGFDKVLRSLKKQVYIGVSAGSIAMGTRIFTASSEERKNYSKEIGKHQFDSALGLVRFDIRPHFVHRKEFSEKKLENMAKEFKTTIYALDDNSAILVDGVKMEVISEGKWKKFEK